MKIKKNYSEGNEHVDLACPECGAPMELVWSDRYRYKDGRRRPFYRCYKSPECTGTHGAHPNGAPLGRPANKETRVLRMKVHAELDKIFPWKKKIGKVKTHRWLLERDFGGGHVANMSATECRDALIILKKKVK